MTWNNAKSPFSGVAGKKVKATTQDILDAVKDSREKDMRQDQEEYNIEDLINQGDYTLDDEDKTWINNEYGREKFPIDAVWDSRKGNGKENK